MKEAFESLNEADREMKRNCGIQLSDYTFAIEVCDALLAKMERETKRVKRQKTHHVSGSNEGEMNEN